MKTTATRKIVKIDENKCTGCGLCVPSCAEGAIRIIDGKARLVAENLCDGLGNCLGECPYGAITIEDRPAEEFDPRAVEANAAISQEPPKACGCPGAAARMLLDKAAAPARNTANPPAAGPKESLLRHWPVQLALLPEQGPIWHEADVLIAADCVAFAMPDFQTRLLAGKSLAIACPKLDDTGPYVEKLARIFAHNDIRSITVAHMSVPCCFGLTRIVSEAIRQAGATGIAMHEITVTPDGQIE